MKIDNDKRDRLDLLGLLGAGLLERIRQAKASDLPTVREDIIKQMDAVHADRPDAADEIACALFSADSALATVLQSHLFLEWCLGQILFSEFPNYPAIAVTKEYSFSIKLDFAFAANLIPEVLYDDLKTMNKIRNQFAHNRHIEIADIDLSSFTWFKETGIKFKDEDRDSLGVRVLLSMRVIAFFLVLEMDVLYPLPLGNLIDDTECQQGNQGDGDLNPF